MAKRAIRRVKLSRAINYGTFYNREEDIEICAGELCNFFDMPDDYYNTLYNIELAAFNRPSVNRVKVQFDCDYNQISVNGQYVGFTQMTEMFLYNLLKKRNAIYVELLLEDK